MAEEHVEITLIACDICNRTFNESSLEKHKKVCEKVLKKRIVFDSSKQRLSEEAKNLKKTAERSKSMTNSTKGTNKSTKLHDPSKAPASSKKTITAQRSSSSKLPSTSKPSTTTTPPPTSSSTGPRGTLSSTPKGVQSPDRNRRGPARQPLLSPIKLETCPRCKRSFCDRSFEKHVMWCNHQADNTTFSLYKTMSNDQAKKRLEARTHYKPPVPKAKRN